MAKTSAKKTAAQRRGRAPTRAPNAKLKPTRAASKAKPAKLAAEELGALLVDVDLLREDPKNLRKHGARNLSTVERSLRRFGFHTPIVARQDGTVVIGNARLAMSRKIGWSHVPAIRTNETDRESIARAIADNRAGELAAWFEGELLAELAELGDLAADAGFLAEEIAELEGLANEHAGELAELTAEPSKTGAGAAKEPEALGVGVVDEGDTRSGHQKRIAGAETKSAGLIADETDKPKRAVARTGDLYTLGRHRLLVGDSTTREAIERLMGEDLGKARVVYTDPPFAIYGSSTGVDQSVADDSVVRPFFRAVADGVAHVLMPFGHAYICCDWRSYPAVRDEATGFLVPKNLIVWSKDSFSPHHYHYANNHELAAFFVKEPKARSMFSKEVGHRRIGDSNVWTAKVVPVQKRYHFAAKPPENIERAIVNSDPEGGGIVVDLFGGSGQTLLVAETIGRSCRMMEKDQGMADVIVKRWQDQTGEKATCIDAAGKSVERKIG